jgi:hypothetical protein
VGTGLADIPICAPLVILPVDVLGESIDGIIDEVGVNVNDITRTIGRLWYELLLVEVSHSALGKRVGAVPARQISISRASAQ